MPGGGGNRFTWNMKIVEDSETGFARLDTIPEEATVNSYYRDLYFADKPELARDRAWRTVRAYRLFRLLNRACPDGQSFLDIGAGDGLTCKLAHELYDVTVGVEPNAKLCAEAKFPLVESTWCEQTARQLPTFSHIDLQNVLEHVVDPVGMLRLAASKLNPNGALAITVPRDGSILQAEASKVIGRPEYWVHPTHLNYFTSATLQKVVSGVGLEVVWETTNFAMELFLIAGINYVKSPKKGKLCHDIRCKFEMNLSPDVLEKFYAAMARVGFGREIILIAIKPS